MCGRIHDEGAQYLQACHIFRRELRGTRWESLNALSMCALGCHGKFDKMDPETKLEFILKRITREQYDWLKVRALGPKIKKDPVMERARLRLELDLLPKFVRIA